MNNETNPKLQANEIPMSRGIITKNQRLSTIGEYFLAKKIITKEQLLIAIEQQKKTNSSLSMLVVELGFVQETILCNTLGELFGVKIIVDLKLITPQPDAIRLIAKNTAIQFNVLPIAYYHLEKKLELAMPEIYSEAVLKKIPAIFEQEIEIIPILTSRNEIKKSIDRFYNPPKKKMGDQLIEKGLVTKDQIDIALSEQKKTGFALGRLLVELGFVSESVIRDMLGETFGTQILDLKAIIPDPEAIKFIPKEIALRFNVVPIVYHRSLKTLDVAMSDVHDLIVLDKIRSLLDLEIEINPILSGESELRSSVDRFYGYEMSIDGIIKELETGIVDYASLKNEAEYSQPLVRLVNSILTDAVKRGASDIHFEPEERFLRLRYRIDGVMRQIRSLPKDYWSPMTVRLKVISNMNITETRAAQDGRISLKVSGRQVDFRAASQPTKWGENIVLRILDREKSLVPLENMGLFADNLQLLKTMMARPEGIILVTGPTGSGKTTTLYSMLNFRKSIAINIMTLEDPIEYPMDLIRQTDLSETTRMDFASGIKSLMRQDPDVILIGEIRDEETAQMACRAAMTGHQVFATLHTNSALGAIPRLKNIGVKPDILGGNIIGSIGQRLLRKVCSACKIAKKPDDTEKKLLGLALTDNEQIIYEAKGCDKCEFIGYKGRISILEICKFDAGMEALVSADVSLGEIKEYAIKHGYKMLADNGLRRVLSGDTSISEVARVVDLTDRK